MDFQPVLPIKAIVFQLLFGSVAIALEAGVLRQRLGLGFQQSIQYTTVINLGATIVGWLAFLTIEPLVNPGIREQIISYIFFDQIMLNGWTAEFGAILIAIGLASFFITLIIKTKGLALIMVADGTLDPPEKNKKEDAPSLPRDERYARARGSKRAGTQSSSSTLIDAVIQGNAASFSAILALIVLRALITRGSL